MNGIDTWHNEGFSIIDYQGNCIAVCLTEGLAQFIAELGTKYWEAVKESNNEAELLQKYMDEMKEKGVDIIGITSKRPVLEKVLTKFSDVTDLILEQEKKKEEE